MANHIIYENFVLESRLTNLLNTKLGVRSLMTLDTSLAESAGMKKVINVYNYSGAVETVAKGVKNTTRGQITFAPVDYTVGTSQQVFDYYDEEFMADPKILDMGMEGASTLMVNDINTKYFAELAKATQKSKWAKDSKISYDAVVDAIASLNIEDESGLFLVIGNDLKADLRKDVDFKSAQLGSILFNGQIGTIAGIPVIVSKLVPSAKAYLAAKEAVTLFTKKDSEVEQDRDKEARKNTVIMRKVELVALTDATKVVELSEATV